MAQELDLHHHTVLCKLNASSPVETGFALNRFLKLISRIDCSNRFLDLDNKQQKSTHYSTWSRSSHLNELPFCSKLNFAHFFETSLLLLALSLLTKLQCLNCGCLACVTACRRFSKSVLSQFFRWILFFAQLSLSLFERKSKRSRSESNRYSERLNCKLDNQSNLLFSNVQFGNSSSKFIAFNFLQCLYCFRCGSHTAFQLCLRPPSKPIGPTPQCPFVDCDSLTVNFLALSFPSAPF